MNTENEKLRIIILTHGGCIPLLKSLATIDRITVAGVYVETETAPRKLTLKERWERSIKYDGYAVTITKLLKQFLPLSTPPEVGADPEESRRELEETTKRLGIPLHYLANYHAQESIEFMRQAKADLGIVWGTNILKESVFKIPRMGSINIHQGLAPYYRGGPPVFWELFNNEPEVGITVHFVEAKVDTGEIITQETVPLSYDYEFGLDFESFIAEFRVGIGKNCVRLMTEAVRMIADGTAKTRPQDITLGKRYRLPIKPEKDELKRRLIERAKSAGRSPASIKQKKRGMASS
ncbi:MAG: formyltransferase family protein [Blastocatellia bacterium]|nr:formyltransferase family protein [Blastocatellia bacterium]